MIKIKTAPQLLGENSGMKAVARTGALEAAAQTAQIGRPDFASVKSGSKRLIRERKTFEAMLHCFCRNQHGAVESLCPECQGLLDYATARLERCRFGELKPTCANCPVHCYQPRRREQVKARMRYAGPRMLWRHPVLSLLHFLDGRRKAPAIVEAMTGLETTPHARAQVKPRRVESNQPCGR